MAQEPRHPSRAVRSPVLAVVLALAVRLKAQEVLAVAVTVEATTQLLIPVLVAARQAVRAVAVWSWLG